MPWMIIPRMFYLNHLWPQLFGFRKSKAAAYWFRWQKICNSPGLKQFLKRFQVFWLENQCWLLRFCYFPMVWLLLVQPLTRQLEPLLVEPAAGWCAPAAFVRSDSTHGKSQDIHHMHTGPRRWGHAYWCRNFSQLSQQRCQHHVVILLQTSPNHNDHNNGLVCCGTVSYGLTILSHTHVWLL